LTRVSLQAPCRPRLSPSPSNYHWFAI
jgi:hypothetical protein